MDLAVTHLASMGHRRIGLAVGPVRFVPVVRKRAAFIDAMTRLTGIAPDEAASLVSHSLFAVEGGQAAAHHLLGLRRDRDRVRLGPHGARRDPDDPAARPARAGGRLRRRATTTRG